MTIGAARRISDKTINNKRHNINNKRQHSQSHLDIQQECNKNIFFKNIYIKLQKMQTETMVILKE